MLYQPKSCSIQLVVVVVVCNKLGGGCRLVRVVGFGGSGGWLLLLTFTSYFNPEQISTLRREVPVDNCLSTCLSCSPNDPCGSLVLLASRDEFSARAGGNGKLLGCGAFCGAMFLRTIFSFFFVVNCNGPPSCMSLDTSSDYLRGSVVIFLARSC